MFWSYGWIIHIITRDRYIVMDTRSYLDADTSKEYALSIHQNGGWTVFFENDMIDLVSGASRQAPPFAIM